jgi:malonyl-CoA O-methyltransferase
MTHKQRVTAAFSAAAGTYDTAAEAQALAADSLATRVLALDLPPNPRVLEVGCGTGLLTRRLLPALGGTWIVTDIAPAMVAAARAALPDGAAEFRVMDGEHPDFGPASLDLVVSNLAAQWFADLPAAVGRLAACLKPGRPLLLTTLGAGSFAEWRRAHHDLGLACGTPPYPSADGLQALLAPHGRVTVIAETVPLRYADAVAFLRALKAIGAGTPAAGHAPLPPGALRRVLAALGAPATITYEILTVEVERP